MEDSLGRLQKRGLEILKAVLILVVMEDSLGPAYLFDINNNDDLS